MKGKSLRITDSNMGVLWVIAGRFINWDYGKIGKGIAHGLIKEKSIITAVDINVDSNASFARKQNVNLLHPKDIKEIKTAIKSGYCLVTCTGIEGIITRQPYYQEIRDSSMILVNMGTEDEFGEAFKKERVFNNKAIANFILKVPAKMRYLDPTFYAHNLCYKLYLEGKLKPGFQTFPENCDQQIVKEWSNYWKEDISDIFEL